MKKLFRSLGACLAVAMAVAVSYVNVDNVQAAGGIESAKAVARYSTVRLSWSAVTGHTYQISRSSMRDGAYTLLATGITGAEYLDEQAGVNQVWYYKITDETNQESLICSNKATGMQAVIQNAKFKWMNEEGRTFTGNNAIKFTGDAIKDVNRLAQGTILIDTYGENLRANDTLLGFRVESGENKDKKTFWYGMRENNLWGWDQSNSIGGWKITVPGANLLKSTLGTRSSHKVAYVSPKRTEKNTPMRLAYDGVPKTNAEYLSENYGSFLSWVDLKELSIGGFVEANGTTTNGWTGKIGYVIITDEVLTQDEINAITSDNRIGDCGSNKYWLRTKMSATAGSEQADNVPKTEGPVKYALDGDPRTIWHTDWSSGSQPDERYVVIDVDSDSQEPQLVDGVCILPRQDMWNGRIKNCKIYVSTDGGNTFEDMVATVENWANDQEWKEVKFDPVMATHVKILATSTYGDTLDKDASAAEIRITTPKLDDGHGNVTYNLASYKGTRTQENWLAPKELADKIFVGWYEDAECVMPCAPTRTTGDVYAKFVNREQALRLIGGSLKKTTDAFVKTDLRFGYNIVLPESLGEVGTEGGPTWYWKWGTDENDLKGPVNGVNFGDPRNEKEGTEGFVSNLLITGIPRTAYQTRIYSKLFVNYTTPDGTAVKESGETKERIISEVANEIKGDSHASESDKAYADAILEAVKILR